MTTGEAYEKAGVSLDKAREFKAQIKQLIKERWPGLERQIGKFAAQGLIPPGAKLFKASTDGTGTKIILAALMEMFAGIGFDVVAMAAVDTYVQGALPLYLLDTLKVGCLQPDKHIAIIKSIIEACELAGCKLIGGETAQLPDMFKFPWMVDLDVTAIGFPSDDTHFLPPEAKQRVYGWPSFGPASNGFSLLRKIFDLVLDDDWLQALRERRGWSGSTKYVRKGLERYWPELKSTLGQTLLQPTPIWITQMEEARRSGVKFAGHAHITGGGMLENIPRILGGNEKAMVVIHRNSWQRPPVFRLAQEVGKISDEEMDRVFNQGIMLVSLVSANGPGLKPPAILIGRVERRKPDESQVVLVGKYNDN